ncbi:MAG: phosphodiester glycosidase family protein, partial [Oscillospiraceae bacterium]|nr:phosphodiester glycosidase family protein [Oscillospiraceae bacterium]
MRKRGIIALALVAALLISVAPSVGAVSYSVPNVGTIRREDKVPLGKGATLVMTSLAHQSSGVQEERFIELLPSSNLRAMAVYGNSLYGSTLDIHTLHNRLKAQGLEVTAAVNGDYFSLSSGVPNGGLITDGVVRATDNYQRLVGFPSSGGAFIASAFTYTHIMAQVEGASRTIAVDQVNHSATADRLILFTPDFGANTQTSRAGTHVVINVSGQLKLGKYLPGTVDRVVKGSAPCALRAGQMVLFVADTGPVSRIDGLVAGTPLTIRVSCADNRLTDCPYAIGAYQRLLTGGTVASGLEAGKAPRTAVGVKADGSCVLYTVDGRQAGYSEGLTLTDVARRLRSLGCVDAVNLDGGGSTILSARYPGQSSLTITGRPSDGSPRRVANYIVLVNGTAQLNTAAHLFLYPFTTAATTLLKGASVSFTA